MSNKRAQERAPAPDEIDIRYIKDLLGHLSIKTTERYLHVKRETLVNIPNVLDELNKSVTLDW